ncbi:MAG: MtrB/PioB family outer membrane beta-barrel protein [Acidimicrobiia bacterium]|nr:MtrB/PioB family outer membrane beta-barrel protein [Acidimicrobiia bacterium]
MMIRRNMIMASAIACVVLVGMTATPATAGDDEGFRLWVKPVSVWFLEADQDSNSSKFEEYLDLSSGLWAGLRIGGESADGDRTLALDMSAIGRDHARYTLDYGLSGKYALTIDHNKIRHLFGNGATLLWNQTSPNSFELADPVQEAILDGVLNAPGFVSHGYLTGLLAPYYEVANAIDLGLQRNRTHIRFDLGKLGRLAWALEYNTENRDGNRPMGAAFGFFNVQEIPEPIQYQTTSIELGGEYSYDNGGVRFGVRRSEFTNDNLFVTWDNPFRFGDSTDGRAYLGPVLSSNGPEFGRTSLAPDNEATLAYVDLRGKAGNWWYSGSLSMNTMEQNDEILPFTTNTAIIGTDERTGQTFNAAYGGLPTYLADTEVDVMNLAAAAGTSLGEDLDLTFRFRSYDYDNTSPRLEFPGYVRLDSVWEPYALLTVPYDYTRDNFSAELDWQVSDTTQLGIAYLLESWDRTFREIHDSDEDTIKLSFDSRPNNKFAFRGSWATGDRTTGEYDVEAQEVFFVNPPGINNQPDLRKYDEAERDVDDYDFSAQFFPDDAWNFSFGLSGREEDYSQSVFGLVSDEIGSYNFEMGYAPGAQMNFMFFLNSADRDSFQRARQSGGSLSTNPLDDWALLLNERTKTWGATVESNRESGWSWELSAHVSDSDGEGDFTTPEGGRTAVDITNYEDIKLTSFWFTSGYDLNEKVAFGFFVLLEDYSSNSFISQGIVPYLPSSILLAANDGSYDGRLFGVNLRMMF